MDGKPLHIHSHSDGKHYIVPTVIDGKQHSAESAVDHAIGNKNLGTPYDSYEQAHAAVTLHGSGHPAIDYEKELDDRYEKMFKGHSF